MKYSIGQKVWVIKGRGGEPVKIPGVVVSDITQGEYGPEYWVDVEGYPPHPNNPGWLVLPCELRPRDDGDDEEDANWDKIEKITHGWNPTKEPTNIPEVLEYWPDPALPKTYRPVKWS